MIELITRIFKPEDDEDIGTCQDFVSSLPDCIKVSIDTQNSIITAIFRKKII